VEDLRERIRLVEDRLIDIRIVLTALEWQLKDLILWKDRAELQLAELVKAEQIAEEVTKRIHKTNQIRLTFVQKAFGIVIGGIAVVDFIRSFHL